jgi:CheY-like chemotaxis protein
MPGCDGLQLASQIAADARHRGMRLILLTSAQAVRGGSDIAALGFSAYLLKPVSNRELRECLIRVLSAELTRWQVSTQPVATTAQLAEPLKSRRVLLAEDNPVNQKVACGALRKIGLKVDVAANGVEAVAAWEKGTYDLILMDCQMPVMDGYQAAREIRTRETGARRIPIIALTADAMKGTEQLCREAGMDDYLTKPIDRTRLSEVIRRCLGAAEIGRSSAADHAVGREPVQPSTEAVDWERLMLTAENDTEFADELVKLFIESGDSVLKEIRDALDRGDLAAVGRAAHSLKGSSANMHANSTSEAAARLESAARSGAVRDVPQLETQLRAETQRAIDYLRARRRSA